MAWQAEHDERPGEVARPMERPAVLPPCYLDSLLRLQRLTQQLQSLESAPIDMAQLAQESDIVVKNIAHCVEMLRKKLHEPARDMALKHLMEQVDQVLEMGARAMRILEARQARERAVINTSKKILNN